MTLNALADGQTGIVSEIRLDKRTRRRLVEMGVTPGVAISIAKRAPLGDPIEVRLRGYELMLREEDAKNIIIVAGGRSL